MKEGSNHLKIIMVGIFYYYFFLNKRPLNKDDANVFCKTEYGSKNWTPDMRFEAMNIPVEIVFPEKNFDNICIQIKHLQGLGWPFGRDQSCLARKRDTAKMKWTWSLEIQTPGQHLFKGRFMGRPDTFAAQAASNGQSFSLHTRTYVGPYIKPIVCCICSLGEVMTFWQRINRHDTMGTDIF